VASVSVTLCAICLFVVVLNISSMPHNNPYLLGQLLIIPLKIFQSQSLHVWGLWPNCVISETVAYHVWLCPQYVCMCVCMKHKYSRHVLDGLIYNALQLTNQKHCQYMLITIVHFSFVGQRQTNGWLKACI